MLLVLVFVVVLAIALVFFFSLVLLLTGIVAALALLGARILSLATWSVEARSARTVLVWRVRGVLKSARAVRELAAALRRGGESLVDGRGPDTIKPTQV